MVEGSCQPWLCLSAATARLGPGMVKPNALHSVPSPTLRLLVEVARRDAPRLCAGSRYARRDVPVAPAPSISAHYSLRLRSRFATAAAVLQSSGALTNAPSARPPITGRCIRSPCRWPAATSPEPTPLAGSSPPLHGSVVGSGISPLPGKGPTLTSGDMRESRLVTCRTYRRAP